MSISGISANNSFQMPTKPPSEAASTAAAPQQAESPSKPLTGTAAWQDARTTYQRTGVDKDAAMGDPDHDAGRKAPHVTAPSTTAEAASSTTSSSTGTTGATGSTVNVVA